MTGSRRKRRDLADIAKTWNGHGVPITEMLLAAGCRRHALDAAPSLVSAFRRSLGGQLKPGRHEKFACSVRRHGAPRAGWMQTTIFGMVHFVDCVRFPELHARHHEKQMSAR